MSYVWKALFLSTVQASGKKGGKNSKGQREGDIIK